MQMGFLWHEMDREIPRMHYSLQSTYQVTIKYRIFYQLKYCIQCVENA